MNARQVIQLAFGVGYLAVISCYLLVSIMTPEEVAELHRRIDARRKQREIILPERQLT